MGTESYEAMLTGGHPNSLGRTIEVVDDVLQNRYRVRALLDCYDSENEVVRLRTSNAVKRVEEHQHDWLTEHLDELIDKVGALDQASAQWTLAHLFSRFTNDMSADQFKRALAVLKRNIQHHDWIVLIQTLDTLSEWAANDASLRKWLKPHVERLASDPRKSVAARASKKYKLLYGA